MSMYTLGNALYTGERSYNIIGRRKLWFTIAGALILISVLMFAVRDVNLGIEFRGGSQFTVSGAQTKSQSLAVDVVRENSSDDSARVSEVGADSIRVQTAELDDIQTQEVRAGLAEAYGVDESNVASTYIGPTWGADVLKKAVQSFLIFVCLIVLILWAYFRTWTIAIGAVGALVNDLLITAGVYVASGFEVTPATVIGFLTILGYSLYDTVVVFDKVRENTEAFKSQTAFTYGEQANLAVNQTLIRSINTSVTGLLPVGAVLVIGVAFQGAGTLRDLSLALFVGMTVSALSSIFIAAPIAVWFKERSPEIHDHTERVLRLRGDAAPVPAHPDTDIKPANAGQHLGQRAQPKRRRKKK